MDGRESKFKAAGYPAQGPGVHPENLLGRTKNDAVELAEFAHWVVMYEGEDYKEFEEFPDVLKLEFNRTDDKCSGWEKVRRDGKWVEANGYK